MFKEAKQVWQKHVCANELFGLSRSLSLHLSDIIDWSRLVVDYSRSRDFKTWHSCKNVRENDYINFKQKVYCVFSSKG